MIEIAAERLAGAVLDVARGEQPIETMFGTVTSTAVGNIRVRPDFMTSGDIGPLPLFCGSVTLNARVLCLFIPDSGVWGVVGR